MCISREAMNAMNQKMAEIQSLKRLEEETEANISSLERELITLLTENEDDCKATK